MKELKFSCIIIVGAMVFFACENHSFAICLVLFLVLGALLSAMIRYEEMTRKLKFNTERQEKIKRLQENFKRGEKKDKAEKLDKTMKYTEYVFSHAMMSVEDVEQVCEEVRIYIEVGYVPVDECFQIPYNKNLRNAELKQFAINIIRYNQKNPSSLENFLTTVFGNWFTGKRENISKNYNVLPKDSIVSKEGLEKDLERLRAEKYN